jgi:very-short-patch-repair endonuclease
MSQYIHNRNHLKNFRKELRNNLTPAEAVLWKALQGKQLLGMKFRRQHSVENYILDFYCPRIRLAIELDGQAHFSSAGMESDMERDILLSNLHITVLRFENKAIFDNLAGVLEEISQCVMQLTISNISPEENIRPLP